MPTSDAAANAALDREVRAGGSWWLGLALNSGVTELDDSLSVAVEESTLPRVEVPRSAAFWDAADGRTVRPLAPLDLGVAADDETATAWVLWDSSSGGTPQHAARIPDTDITSGSSLVLPVDSLVLTYP